MLARILENVVLSIVDAARGCRKFLTVPMLTE